MAETLSDQGYLVVGVNIRQYLSAFTLGAAHLEVADAPGDFHVIGDLLRQKQLLARPVILSGVSEGAALAVLFVSGYLGSRMVFDQGVGVARMSKKRWRALAVAGRANVPPES